MLAYLMTFGALWLSTLARVTLGFGDALIAMPLLTMVLGIQTAAPLVALIGTTSALLMMWRQWQAVELHATWRILLAAFAGIPLGLWFLRTIPEQYAQALLGVLIIGFSMYSVAQPRFVLRRDRFGIIYVFGFVAGLLGGAYNTVGPMLAIYGHLRRWPPAQFRATLQSCFFPAYGLIAIGHGITGNLTSQVVILYSLALPAVLLAFYVGGKLNTALPHARFTRYVNLALLLIGIMLCGRALLK